MTARPIDHPIIFSRDMVLAMLAGRKTQTRRLASSPLSRVMTGDRLWAREGWSVDDSNDGIKPSEIDQDLTPVLYLSDDKIRPARIAPQVTPRDRFKTGRPSIHMPRWMSRLTLAVAEVRIQPLHELTTADAIAEGIFQPGEEGCGWAASKDTPDWSASPVDAYASLWSSLHTKIGERWEDNPPVVAITFTVEHRNIDE